MVLVPRMKMKTTLKLMILIVMIMTKMPMMPVQVLQLITETIVNA